MGIRLVEEVPVSWSLKKKFFTLRWIYLLSEHGDKWLTEKSMVQSIGCSMNTFLALRSDLIELGWIDITEASDSPRMCHYVVLKPTQRTDPRDRFVSEVLSGDVADHQINKLNASSKFVLLYFLTIVDYCGAMPIVAPLAFANELGVSKPTFFRAKKQLRDIGVLKTLSARNRNSLLAINYPHSFLELKKIADEDLKGPCTKAVYGFNNILNVFRISTFFRHNLLRTNLLEGNRSSIYPTSEINVQSEFVSPEKVRKWPSTLSHINGKISEYLRFKKNITKTDDKTIEDVDKANAHISKYLAPFGWLMYCPPVTLNRDSRCYFVRCYFQVLKLIFIKEKLNIGDNETSLLLICHIFGLGLPGIVTADMGAFVLKLSRAERYPKFDCLPKLDVKKLSRVSITFASLLLSLIIDDLKSIKSNLDDWHQVELQSIDGFEGFNDRCVSLYYLNYSQG